MAGVECNDEHCFVHGALSTRGAVVEGRVVSDKAKRTVIVERDLTMKIPKYERYARTRSRIAAHNPDCIHAKMGDNVRIAECRKISKMKAWTVIKIVGKEVVGKEKK